MTNIEIAKLLRQMAAAYAILGENKFKIIAYENAATAVEHATSELKDLWEEGKLDEVPGLGRSIISHLDEVFKKGKSGHFEQVLSKLNPAVFPLLDVPGLGPKKADKLVKSLSLSKTDPITGLEKAAKEHKIAAIPDFGEKSELDILTNIERFRRGAVKERRMTLSEADTLADDIISHLEGFRVDKLGSLRRGVATIGDIDLAVVTNRPQEAIQAFLDYPRAIEVVEKGPTGASILVSAGRQVDLRVAKPEEYGAMLQYFTGSKYHNIRLRDYALKKGLSLSEYGIKQVKSPASPASTRGEPAGGQKSKVKSFRTEEEFYEFLGLSWIPPELREDNGEIEAALNHKLPKLVILKDIKGDLQMHSSDLQETSHDSGEDSIGEMRKIGQNLGYQYIGVSDHNPSVAKHSQEQIIKLLQERKQKIEHINSSIPIQSGSTKGTRVINLLEIDISPDGKLPIPREGLEYLDGCLVAVHSSFNLTKEAMTKRVLAGLAVPQARILAHPTGRLLGEREEYELDWEAVFRFCLEHDKALEINAYPKRLDLPDSLVREAVRKGVKLSLGTDAHCQEDLTLMKYGVTVARRGWAEAKNLVNSWEYAKILAWLRKRG